VKQWHWIVLILVMVALVGCGTPTPAAAPTPTGAATLGAEVSVETVSQLVAEGGVTVIDVREESEFAGGHIPGAVLIPLGELPDRVSEVPTDQPVILACRSDNRSGQAYQFLKQQGFTNVHNMTGGMNAWQKAGFEVEK